MNITIYSTATCGFCKMLKKYLDDKGFKYTVKMADEDEAVARELFERSHQFAVPFTYFEKDDGSTAEVLGFDVPKINSVLGIS